MSREPGIAAARTVLTAGELDELRLRLPEFLARDGLADRTIETYEYYFAQWEHHCEALGVPAVPAPPGAVVRWLVAAYRGTIRTTAVRGEADEARSDGERLDERVSSAAAPRPVSMTVVDQMLAAVRWAHRRNGEPSPTEHRYVVAMRQGYRRSQAKVQPVKAVPIDPDAMRALMQPQPTWSPAGRARQVALLLAHDYRLPLATIAGIAPEDLRLPPGGAGAITLPDRTLLLTCRHERVHGVPWDCLRCALAELRDLVPDDAPFLLGITATGGKHSHDYVVVGEYEQVRAGLVAMVRNWTRRAPATGLRSWPIDLLDDRLQVDPRVAADLRLAAGLRRGLSLCTSVDGLALEQMRAATLPGWNRGLRSDDLRGVRLGDLDRTDRGYLLDVGRSKGDQAGDDPRVPIVATKDPTLDPVLALDGWIPVLEAAAIAAELPARTVPLVTGRESRGNGLTLRPVGYCSMWWMIAHAQDRAGLERRFSPHSMRTGFAVTAADQKASATQIQTALRQKNPDIAVDYVRSRTAAERRAPRLLAGHLEAAQ